MLILAKRIRSAYLDLFKGKIAALLVERRIMQVFPVSQTSPIRLDLQYANYVVALTLELGKKGDLCWVGKNT